ISGFARRVSTEFPSFFPGKDSPRPGLVLRHAFGDSLQHREPAKKQNPNEPARHGDVSDNETRHCEAVTFQFRVRLDSRQGEVAANNSTDRGDEKKSATKPAQTEDAEDQRENGELFGLTLRDEDRRRRGSRWNWRG